VLTPGKLRGEACLPQVGSDEPGEMRLKKKKGETVVEPQFHPESLYQS
jgi:hypothetical protein